MHFNLHVIWDWLHEIGREASEDLMSPLVVAVRQRAVFGPDDCVAESLKQPSRAHRRPLFGRLHLGWRKMRMVWPILSFDFDFDADADADAKTRRETLARCLGWLDKHPSTGMTDRRAVLGRHYRGCILPC